MTPFVDPDLGKPAEQLFGERLTRMAEALQLKQPDRIPIVLGPGYMLAEMYGVTRQEQHENGETEIQMLLKAAQHFQPDSIMGVFNNPASSYAIGGDVMVKFPGHGLDANGSFQFVEGEYMKAEDYDAFIEDPADWSIRKYWPRVFPELAGLGMLPPLGMAAFGTYNLYNLGILQAPPVAHAIQMLLKAGEAQAKSDARTIETTQRLAAAGFAPPPLAGSLIEAPFDFMSDTLRGMRGIMLDIHRRPDKLLAAMEKVLKFELEHAIAFSNATGLKTAFIPLHRGSDGFMSLPQFEKFYWPTLRAMMLVLVDNGIMPFCFYEGIWDQRLKYLAELPAGKTAGWFQFSDIFKVKEIVGKAVSITGGMRNSMLQAGTEEDVRAFTKRLCAEVGKDGGFLMSVGVGEMEGCKPELVKVWIETTKELGVYA
jgi:uroporphyrinogen-III decarboxylase